MEKELKIRIWDGTKMYYSDEENPLVEIALTHKGLVANGWSGGGEWLFEVTIVKVMLYIGLKDKNGKEIYEGDRVSKYNSSEAVVVWCEERAMFIIQDGYNEPIYQHILNIEVTGNIYEN